MTPLNFLLANQDLSLQTRPPNKKARLMFIGLSFRVIKTISQKRSLFVLSVVEG